MLIDKSGTVGCSKYMRQLLKIIFTSHDFRQEVFILHKVEQHFYDVYIHTYIP